MTIPLAKGKCRGRPASQNMHLKSYAIGIMFHRANGFMDPPRVMAWDVQLDRDFAVEAADFPSTVRVEIAALAGLLREFGPQLRRPHCDTLNGSAHANMKELRFTVADGEWRIAFAFDPKRSAILLVGASKSGKAERQFYRDLIRIADKRFGEHLARLSKKDGERK
ncbi:type II toxin-antitoxin system RelE/ParE family toxin [Niveispirillum cyanobacteriorum]|nr:type II toxin-antitoxin system RelE/ParE family toxin [Niveispirillum cyanobacteriorum]